MKEFGIKPKAQEVIAFMESQRNESQRSVLMRFFKTGPGEYGEGDEFRGRDEILSMYLRYAEQANNWDLVDLSAPKILGHWLLLPSSLGDTDYKIKVLDELAQSLCLWKQRMSIVCSWKTSQMGDPSWCLRYAEKHLHHPHDLMHKAVGWMLREMGKRVSMDILREYLHQHAHEMPRTMLRYAIEKMSEPERKEWMKA